VPIPSRHDGQRLRVRVFIYVIGQFYISPSNICCFFAKIMIQEMPTGVDVLDAHRKQAAERKGRRNIETLPITKGSDARADKGSTALPISQRRGRGMVVILPPPFAPLAPYRHPRLAEIQWRWTRPHPNGRRRQLLLSRPSAYWRSRCRPWPF